MLIIIATDKENELLKLLNILEINTNVILCTDININIDIPIIKFEDISNRLKRTIWKNSYEKNNIFKINYGIDIEKSISLVEKYLKDIIDYKNIRWLSIYILSYKPYDLINKYLEYDINKDEYLLELIEKINIKNEIKKKKIEYLNLYCLD